MNEQSKWVLTIEEAAEMSGYRTGTPCGSWWTGASCLCSKVGRKTIIRRDTLERFMTVNQGRNLLNQNDVRRVD